MGPQRDLFCIAFPARAQMNTLSTVCITQDEPHNPCCSYTQRRDRLAKMQDTGVHFTPLPQAYTANSMKE